MRQSQTAVLPVAWRAFNAAPSNNSPRGEE